MSFGTGVPNAVVIDNSGNVGIGTTGPTSKLHILGSWDAFQLDRTGIGAFTNGVTTLMSGDNADLLWSPAQINSGYLFRTYSGTALVNALGIDKNGNVGIGTTSPSSKLHVVGQCVTGDTLLSIRRRKRRRQGYDIEPEPDDNQPWDHLLCRIDQILPGDEVLSLNFATQSLEFARINHLMDRGIKQVYELTTKSGRTIRTTAEHPYLTLVN